MKDKQIKEDLSGKDLSGKNPALQRLMKFIESKGRPSAIAKKVGMSDNVFSNMINRDTKPSVDLLISLSSEYPELDIHYISTGDVSKELKELRERYKTMEENFSRELAYQKMIITKFAEPGKTKVPTRSSDSKIFRRKEYAKKATTYARKGGIGSAPARNFYGNVTLSQSGI